MLPLPGIGDLNQQFGIPGSVTVSAGNGGLPKVAISTPAADGEVYLHGGHVTSWRPTAHHDVIYCSPKAHWHDGIAIRGGVPVCFPWFGDKADNPAAPAHGFVRTKSWDLQAIAATGDAIAVTLATASDAVTRKWWPHDFRLQFRATFGSTLRMELIVTNTGDSNFVFEEALHAYIAVGDVQRSSLRIADALHYFDKTDSFREKPQAGEIRLTSETDRIYFPTTADIAMYDPAWSRCIALRKQNSTTTVIWNPWAAKSAAMADLGAGEWKSFVCVETSNVGVAAVPLAPGESHTMAATIHVTDAHEELS